MPQLDKFQINFEKKSWFFLISLKKLQIVWKKAKNQEIDLKDVFTYNGRISRSNFRALSLLAIGMMICVFFSPGLLGAIGKGRRGNPELMEKIIQNSAPIVHLIGFSIIGIAMILLAIKRIRDTGNPIWKLLIPIYNLKILYFDESYK